MLYLQAFWSWFTSIPLWTWFSLRSKQEKKKICLILLLSESLLIYEIQTILCACMLSRFSRVQLFVTLWTVACQNPLSMGFFRQEYLSGLPCSPPGHLPDLGIQPVFLTSPVLAGGFFTTAATWEAHSERSTELSD